MQRMMALTGLAVWLWAAGSSVAAEPARPNVLMIAIDDLNHWVGYLGRNRQTLTPHIDRLAAQGVRFSRSYCAAPVCNPSRAALLTGFRPSTSGIYDNSDDWRPVVPREKTLISAFRGAGYYVAGAGKIYHSSFHRPDEWEDYLQSEGPSASPPGRPGVGGIEFAPVDANDEDLADARIVQYGIDQFGRAHDRPFFLTIGLHKPHMPWYVPRKYYDMHPLSSIELPPTRPDDLDDVPASGRELAERSGDHRDILQSGRWKEAVQGYLAAISFCDAMVGRLLDALAASQYRDNTIIVFWGDHGWHLGEKRHWRKFALWEEATRAPLIWVAPGVNRPGSLCERTVDFMTIYPTLCDLAGIPTPDHVEGKSIRHLLVDPAATWDEPAVTTFRQNNHTVRTELWRYIRYADGGEELYDESHDPYEWTNLAADPRWASQKSTLAQLLPANNAPPPRGHRDQRPPGKRRHR